MKWIEVNPLPQVCTVCKEEECYNCDFAGERWVLSENDQLEITKKALQRATERMQKRIKRVGVEVSEG